MLNWKTRNPKIKVIWSLGGWSYSRPFFEMTTTREKRTAFIDSVINWLDQPAMFFVDGIDIDWEFPGGAGLDGDVGDASVDAANYLDLMIELRAALDAYGDPIGFHFELSNAIGVGNTQLNNWAVTSTIHEMLPLLDRLGLMTYDFAGSWS